MARPDALLSLDATPSGGNPYLSGNYAPVGNEQIVDEPLEVTGTIPPALSGLLLRNGPNPAVVPDPSTYHWFLGDGMVHAIELRSGLATRYANRWVRTRRLAAEIGTPSPRGPKEALNGPANTHVLEHAGRILALVESGFPRRLSRKLDTICVEDFDAMLASPMTAHPKVDPDTGSLVFFGYDVFGPPYLRYHELDASGALTLSAEIDLPRCVMMHDFAVSATRVAFMDLPVVFDRDLAALGYGLPFSWRPEAGARLGILARQTFGAEVRWIDLDPCYVFHVMNTFDDGGSFVMDVCKYEQTFDTGPGALIGSGLATLERWRIDPDKGAVDVRAIDDTAVELPRVDEHLAGRPYRYGYCVELARNAEGEGAIGLVRYDHQRDEALRLDFGAAMSPGEPVFVRAPDGRADDEGWVLSVVYDATRDASDLWILDASAWKATPDAIVHLPARVPFGFHGSWLPDPLR